MSKKKSRESVDLPGLPQPDPAAVEASANVATADPQGEPAGGGGYQTRQPEVIRWPAFCPKCQGIERIVLRADPFPHRPLLIGDRLFPGRTVRRVQCKKCGTRYKENEPLGDPDSTPNDAVKAEPRVARVRRLIREQLRAKNEHRAADVARLETEITELLEGGTRGRNV